jgi:hypothetical protein
MYSLVCVWRVTGLYDIGASIQLCLKSYLYVECPYLEPLAS